MRISDWSSDVCSSDLIPSVKTQSPEILPAKALLRGEGEPQAHYRVDDEMLDLRMIASIYVAQAMSLTEYMFGGSGEGTAGEGIDQSIQQSAIRTEESRVGEEDVSTWRSRWWTNKKKQKK